MLLKQLKWAIPFIFISQLFFSQDLYQYEKDLILSDNFYYILNLVEKKIILKFNGIELTSYNISEIEFLVPKIFFIKLKPKPFPSIFYIKNAMVEPPIFLLRPNLNPQEKKEEEKPPIPPTLEELIRVPKEFKIKGNEEFSFLFSLKKEANFPLKTPFFKKIGKAFKNFYKGLTLKREPIILLKMENEEGEKFYRSFQDHSSFLVIVK